MINPLVWVILFGGGGLALGAVLFVIGLRGLRKSSREKPANRGSLPEGCLIALLVLGIIIFLVAAAFAGCGLLINGFTGTSGLQSHQISP